MTRLIEEDVTVVGLNFRAKKDARAVLAASVAKKPLSLALYREPENKYDANAIQVYGAAKEWDGVHLGYLARSVAEVLAPRMDDGTIAVVDCFLTEVFGPDHKMGEAHIVIEDLS